MTVAASSYGACQSPRPTETDRPGHVTIHLFRSNEQTPRDGERGEGKEVRKGQVSTVCEGGQKRPRVGPAGIMCSALFLADRSADGRTKFIQRCLSTDRQTDGETDKQRGRWTEHSL